MNTNRNNVSRPTGTVRTDARDLAGMEGVTFYIAGNPTAYVLDKATYEKPRVRIDYHVGARGTCQYSMHTLGLSTIYVVQAS